MQTKSNILFLVTILMLVLSSCVKDHGEFQESLVIVSLINPSNNFEVIIKKTAPALGNHNNLEVEDAVVNIKNNETQETFDLSHDGEGVYTSKGGRPLSGYDYEIRVFAPGFEDAFAVTYIPDLRELSDVVVDIPDNPNGKDQISVTFSPKFTSSSSSSYFAYELVYERPEEDEGEEIITSTENNNAPVVDPIDKPSTLLPIVGAISDGGETTINTNNTLNEKGEPADIQDVYLRIVAVSPQYHAYLMQENSPEQTHYSSVYNHENDVFTNFVGGAYGIFGGFSQKKLKLVD